MEIQKIKNGRIAYLQSLKRAANKYLAENKDLKEKSNKTWELEVLENNIKTLKSIISGINHSLSETALSDYIDFEVAAYKHFQDDSIKHLPNHKDIRAAFKKIGDELALFEIIRYSPSYSIVHDLYWIEDGTVGDQLKVALGEKQPDLFENYLPGKVKKLQDEVLVYFQRHTGYAKSAQIIKSAIEAIRKKAFLVSNILLITATESTVRTLAKFVYSKQNQSASEEEIEEYIYRNFLSLETLILKGDWKNDFEISVADAALLSRYVNDGQLLLANELIERCKKLPIVLQDKLSEVLNILQSDEVASDEEKSELSRLKLEEIMQLVEENKSNPALERIKVSLRTQLHFLLRRYKEDRNQIIHGNYFDFDKGWKTYVYCSAICKIHKIILGYEKMYN